MLLSCPCTGASCAPEVLLFLWCNACTEGREHDSGHYPSASVHFSDPATGLSLGLRLGLAVARRTLCRLWRRDLRRCPAVARRTLCRLWRSLCRLWRRDLRRCPAVARRTLCRLWRSLCRLWRSRCRLRRSLCRLRRSLSRLQCSLRRLRRSRGRLALLAVAGRTSVGRSAVVSRLVLSKDGSYVVLGLGFSEFGLV